MKFSKALVALAPFFLFDQAAADEEPAEPSSSGAKPKSVVVSSTRSSDGPVHVVIPYHGNEEDNGRKKERELETTSHDHDARLLSDVTLNYGPGGFCDLCGQINYECSSDGFGNWNNGERSFTDTLNEPVGEMKVEVFGNNCDAGPIEVSLNDNVLGELASLSDLCPCGTCNSSSGCLSVVPAWYEVGQENTIKIREKTDGLICVDRVELELLPVGQSCAPSSNPTESIKPSASQSSTPSSNPTKSIKPSASPSSAPSSLPSMVPSDQPSSVPSDIPSDVPSDQPSSIPSSSPSTSPSSAPSSLPSMVPSDQPSSVPSDIPSDVPSDQPSSIPSSSPSTSPSSAPSSLPSLFPSSEPSWVVDDEQCKKKDPEDDICAELDGRCKVDCEDDENFVCVPGLCSYDRNWDKPTKSPKMRQLNEDDVEVVDFEITADGGVERKLKATKATSEKEGKATKGTKAPKSSCACRVPRKRGCKK